MTTTGWLGNDEPDERAPEPRPATGFADFILANRADPGRGRTLGDVLARAAQAPDRGGPEPADLDDRMAGLLTRGYSPGAISQLSMRLGDTEAELQAEREKIERGQRRQEHVRRAHEAGRITAWDIPDLLDDLGDEGKVAQLERQATSLRQQIDEASEAITPPRPRQLDGVEAASRRAHELFREVTRARMAELEAGVRRSGPRPFAGRGVAVRSEVTCAECVKAGATAEQSFLIHQDPDAPIESEFVGLSEQVLAAFGQRDQAERRRDDYGMAVR